MLSFKSFINEKRSHPEQNPKLSAYDELKDYAKLDGYYISFTKLDKLGINPQSEFSTPLGIFAYQLKETWKEYGVDKYKDFRQYPFANENPYIWLFKAKEPSTVLNLSKYTKSDYKRDIVKLKELPNTVIDWDSFIKRVEDDSKIEGAAGYIWNLTRWVANNYTNPNKPYLNLNIKWSNILRKLYSGVVDNGNEIVHENEPIQSVFFSKSAIELIKKVNNISLLDSKETDIVVSNINDIKKIPFKILLKTDSLWEALKKDKPISINYPSDERIIVRFPLSKKFYIFVKNNIDYIENEIGSDIIKNLVFRDEFSNALRMVIGNIVSNVKLNNYPNITQFIIKLIDKFDEFEISFSDYILFKDDFKTYSSYQDEDIIKNNITFIKEKRL